MIKYAPKIKKQLRALLSRTVYTEDHTSDFLLTPTRDRDVAKAFLRKAIRKGQLLTVKNAPHTPAERQFSASAAQITDTE